MRPSLIAFFIFDRMALFRRRHDRGSYDLLAHRQKALGSKRLIVRRNKSLIASAFFKHLKIRHLGCCL